MPDTGTFERMSWMTWTILWMCSGIVITSLCIVFVDRDVATWSHEVLRRPPVAVAFTELGGMIHELGAALLVLAACGVARFRAGRLGSGWRTALYAAVATLLAIVAMLGAKYGFGRLWPETWIQHNPSWISNGAFGFRPFHGGRGYESFPSGHTARLTVPFAVLWQRVPRWRAVWVLPPVVMSAALIAANFHFVGDCIGGAWLAAGCAALTMKVGGGRRMGQADGS